MENNTTVQVIARGQPVKPFLPNASSRGHSDGSIEVDLMQTFSSLYTNGSIEEAPVFKVHLLNCCGAWLHLQEELCREIQLWHLVTVYLS